MTTTALPPGATSGVFPTTVSVACTDSALRPAAGLQAALAARTLGQGVRWQVTAVTELAPDAPVAIVLCDADSVSAVTRRWPGCAVVAVVDDRDDGMGVIAALQAGAATCIRGENPAIAAAFIVAVARRDGLIAEDIDQ